MRQGKGMFWGLVVSLLIVSLCGGFSLAATQLDSTFGENGFVVKDFGLGDDEVYGLAVQGDGKIIAAGYSNNGAVKDLAVARYLPNGELDTDFSNDGTYTLSMGSGDTVGRSLVLQDDGKIVLAGFTNDGGYKIAVIRLTTEGNLDSSFGVDGQLMIPVEDGTVKTGEVQIAPDGTVVVAGSIEADDATIHSFFAKLNSQGELDASFGSDGIALIKQEAYGINITTFVLLEGGKILAGGSVVNDGVPEAGLFRLNEDGSIDESYGINGESLLTIEGTASAVNDILVGNGGTLLVAGYVDNGDYREAFVGMVDDKGDFVSDFGASGLYRSPLLYENAANAVALQNDGSVLVAGYADAGQGNDVFLMTVEGTTSSLSNLQQTIPLSEPDQVAAEGDESSDKSGNEQLVAQSVELQSTYVATDIASNDDIGYAIAILPDGNVLTAGSSGNGSDLDFAVLRYASEAVGTISAGGNYKIGARTAGYYFLTEPVTALTRVGAASGGRISKLSDLSCETCKSQCETETTADACLAGCLTECQTVTLRGVTYSVVQNPIYRVASADTPTPTPAAGDAAVLPQDKTFIYDTVRSGQTEDGSGLGNYGSDIIEITPDTTYYLRAYAVLSDDTVIYGNQVTFKTKDACFIATAAYGSLLDKHVVILREFRDRIMMGDRFGRQLVGMYYHFSPPIAGVIEQNELLRATVRVILLPVVLLAFFILKTTLAIKFSLLAAIVGLGLVVSRFLRKVQVTPI